LSMSKNELVDFLGSDLLMSLTGKIETVQDGSRIVVKYPATWGEASETTIFDLSEPEQYAFFAELEYISTIPKLLTANKDLRMLVEDDVPDVLAFTLTSLTGLVQAYGRDSAEYVCALHLVDAALPHIMSNILDLYPERAVAEVLLLGSHPSTVAVDSREANADLVRLLPHETAVDRFFPQVYLANGQQPTQLQNICETMSMQSVRTGFQVYCTGLATPSTKFNTLAQTKSTANGFRTQSDTDPTDEEIAIYQIVLWTSILLTFTAIYAAYAIAGMEFKKDTLLYSTYNPGWKDKKH